MSNILRFYTYDLYKYASAKRESATRAAKYAKEGKKGWDPQPGHHKYDIRAAVVALNQSTNNKFISLKTSQTR